MHKGLGRKMWFGVAQNKQRSVPLGNCACGAAQDCAKIVTVDRASRKLSLTIKGKEVEEEKQAMAEFGSSDSGASLGDILGAAIRRRNQQAQTESD